MKAQLQNPVTGTTKTGWENISKSVSETIAKETSKGTRIFGAIDMWNIQRKRRSYTVR